MRPADFLRALSVRLAFFRRNFQHYQGMFSIISRVWLIPRWKLDKHIEFSDILFVGTLLLEQKLLVEIRKFSVNLKTVDFQQIEKIPRDEKFV